MKIIADANIPFVAKCFSSIGEVRVISGREITPTVISGAEVLLVRSVTRVDASLLNKSRISFVGTATIGYDHIDTEYLSQNNIGFASAPGSNANSAAEYVIASLLEIGQEHKITLEGKSIGIIGVGNVGSRVAKKATALGMKVKLNDPPLKRQSRAPKYLDIAELFDCDFITFHMPLTFEGVDKTFHLADENFFKSLKAGCVFINASRGGVVDSKALKAAINAGLLKAVALDVWENEPNIDMELLQMIDIGTPHIAGYSLDGKIAGMIMIYKAVCKYYSFKERYCMDDFLPEPVVPHLTINPGDGKEQELLRQAVQRIYNISEDDGNLRRVINQPPEKRGEFFDSLRKNYHVRREFQNTRIILATPLRPQGYAWQAENTEDTENKLKKFLDKLAGIGFKVADEQKH